MQNKTEPNKNQTDPAQLARLMSLDYAERPEWEPAELSAILRHQLSAPLAVDLALTDPLPEDLQTFAQLLHHPHPPVRLLELTQQFAKQSARHSDSPIPREIATALYYASIIAALLRYGQRISQLEDSALRRGLEALLTPPWVDEKTRGLFNEGLNKLNRSP